MSDEQKMPAQREEELARLRREVAGLRAVLAAEKTSRPVDSMPGDYDLLFETLAEALLVVRIRDGLILRANPCCRRLLGLAESDLAGKTLYDFLPEAARARAEALLCEAAAGNRLVLQHEAVCSRPDGASVALRIGGAVLGDGPEAAALLYLQDVTESREAMRLQQETEQRYRLVVESAADPIFMFDRAGRFVSANPAAAKGMHCRPEDLIGKVMQDLFPPEIAERQWRQVKRVFETGDPLFSEENESRTAEGPRCFNTSLTPVRNERGEVEYVIGIARDVTDRKRAEAALRESRQELQAVQDTMADGILIADIETRRFVRANPAVCRMLGYAQEELLTKAVEDIYPRDRLEEVQRLFEAQVRGERTMAPDVPCLRKDGSVFFAEISAALITVDGRACAMGVFRDITERKVAEDARRRTEEQYRSLFDQFLDGVAIIGEDGILKANEAYARMHGLTPQEMIGRKVWGFTEPHDQDRARRRIAGLLGGDTSDQVNQYRLVHPDGGFAWVETRSQTVTWAGRPAVQAIVRDITDRKKAEEALREREGELQAVQDAMVDALVIVDIETQRLVRLNPAAYRMFGYAPGELDGMLVHALHPPEDVEFTNSQFRNRLQGIFNPVSEIRCLRKDGRLFVADMSSAPIMIGDRRCTMGVFRDVSERKKAEEVLRQSEENYRLLFESNINGIAIIVDGRVVRANKAYCDIHRFSPEAITGMNPLDFVDPQRREELRGKQEALDRGEITTFGGNFRIVRGDGTAGWVEVRAGLMAWGGKQARLAIVQDVTQRVQLENELREVQKMEAVGQLAGGIAHDFNNLLTGILCSAQLLKTGPDIPKGVVETAEVIERAARRAAELTSQLLGFARRGKHQDVPVDLGATIRSVMQLMSGAIGPHITVEAVLPPAPVWSHGDPSQMEQVVLNLAMNARDAMADAGKLTITAETAELDAAACVGRPSAKPGRYVVLRVSDTGCGIDEDIHDRIFEPFFTTKPIGKGTGMGLAMVYGIARSHGGWVEVDSAVGKGSTFRVYLPALAGPLPQPPAGEAGGEGKKGGRVRGATPAKRRARASAAPRVMVVDDDEMVRKAMTRMLAKVGYSVVTAASGREAVATYGTFGSNIDVVIIDMAMPDMDGLECFQALRRQDPHVKAILCTGGPADEGTRDVVGKGLVDFLPKPYQLEQLAAAIAKALATRRGGPPG